MTKERVNIQYSIDLQELPAEVRRLIARAGEINEKGVKSALKELSAVEESAALSLNTLSFIDTTRKKLAAMDYALNDVADIINGFLHFQVQANLHEKYENLPQNRAPSPVPPPQSDALDVDSES